ncbi:MAG: hypothetical protein ACJAXK_002676 [Yoonia sp.]|jgi:hypothetical protein
MLVFWKENLVFLAVPKTGTTAIEGALAPRAAMVLRDPPQIKHAPLYRYGRFLQPMFEKAGGKNPETIAVIRNPVDWLSSWYRYRNRHSLVGQENSTRNIKFNEFVLEYCKDDPAPFAKVGSQASYVFDQNGKRETTHLFAYEHQPDLIAFLEKRLDTTIELKQLNVSPTIPAIIAPDIEAHLRATKPQEFAAYAEAMSASA